MQEQHLNFVGLWCPLSLGTTISYQPYNTYNENEIRFVDRRKNYHKQPQLMNILLINEATSIGHILLPTLRCPFFFAGTNSVDLSKMEFCAHKHQLYIESDDPLPHPQTNCKQQCKCTYKVYQKLIAENCTCK